MRGLHFFPVIVLWWLKWGFLSRQSERKQPKAAPSTPAAPSIPKFLESFPNLPNPSSLQSLNEHLQCHSYIDGFLASSADLVVLSLVPKPVLASFPHISRWYHHIIALGSSVPVGMTNLHGLECCLDPSHPPLPAPPCLL
jgi:hypothetical protein